MLKQKSRKVVAIPYERIAGKIYYIRSKKVMFDSDLAELYGVKTKVLNQAVKRNIKRFPADFMFQLTKQEAEIFLKYQFGNLETEDSLRSQIVTSKKGGRRYEPYVFTEQGVAMLSSVLNSDRAIMVNIQIMRTFTKLREMLSTHKDLQAKVEKMEKKYDKKFKVIFEVIARFLKTDPKGSEDRVIGFID